LGKLAVKGYLDVYSLAVTQFSLKLSQTYPLNYPFDITVD